MDDDLVFHLLLPSCDKYHPLEEFSKLLLLTLYLAKHIQCQVNFRNQIIPVLGNPAPSNMNFGFLSMTSTILTGIVLVRLYETCLRYTVYSVFQFVKFQNDFLSQTVRVCSPKRSILWFWRLRMVHGQTKMSLADLKLNPLNPLKSSENPPKILKLSFI